MTSKLTLTVAGEWEAPGAVTVRAALCVPEPRPEGSALTAIVPRFRPVAGEALSQEALEDRLQTRVPCPELPMRISWAGVSVEPGAEAKTI